MSLDHPPVSFIFRFFDFVYIRFFLLLIFFHFFLHLSIKERSKLQQEKTIQWKEELVEKAMVKHLREEIESFPAIFEKKAKKILHYSRLFRSKLGIPMIPIVFVFQWRFAYYYCLARSHFFETLFRATMHDILGQKGVWRRGLILLKIMMICITNPINLLIPQKRLYHTTTKSFLSPSYV